MQRMHIALNKIMVEDWTFCVQHAERLQEDFEKVVCRDILGHIVVNIGIDNEVSGMKKTKMSRLPYP